MVILALYNVVNADYVTIGLLISGYYVIISVFSAVNMCKLHEVLLHYYTPGCIVYEVALSLYYKLTVSYLLDFSLSLFLSLSLSLAPDGINGEVRWY